MQDVVQVVEGKKRKKTDQNVKCTGGVTRRVESAEVSGKSSDLFPGGSNSTQKWTR